MAKELKEILIDIVASFWRSARERRAADFKQDFADHVIGAAVGFYQDEAWEKFGVWMFHVYPIPAKSKEDACKILVRVYDIWEPAKKEGQIRY